MDVTRPNASGHACGVERVVDQGRQVRDEAQQLLTSLQQAAAEVRETLRERLGHHPYTVLGVGFGVGYILGGGLPSRVTRLLFDVGSRVAVAQLVQQFTVGITASSNGGAHDAAGQPGSSAF